MLGERDCQKCGTRLMLVVFPPSIRHDEGVVPSYYEDHLLERVTLLEIKLSQVAERLTTALDLMLHQTKNAQSDHILLETLIESLNTLGAVKSEKLADEWKRKISVGDVKKSARDNFERVFDEICQKHQNEKSEIFTHLLKQGINSLKNNEEKQALRNLEHALEISPENVPLLLFISEILFRFEKPEIAKKYLSRIIEIDPENQKALLLSGFVYADLLEIETARENLAKLNENFAAFSRNYILGYLAAFEKHWNSALEYFIESLAENLTPEMYYLAGCVYFQLNKPKTAMRYLLNSVETDKNFADAWFMLAVVYQILENDAKAVQALELAWSSKEAGAICLKYVKDNKRPDLNTALPFIRLKDVKKNLIMGGSRRFTKLIWGEVSKILND